MELETAATKVIVRLPHHTTVQQVLPKEASRIHEFVKEILARDPAVFLEHSLQIADLVNGGRKKSFWVEHDGKPVGLIRATLDKNLGAHNGHLDHFFLKEEFRGQGLGQQLLLKAMGFLRNASCENVFVKVLESQKAAIAFLKKSGFRGMGIYANFIMEGDSYQDAHLYWIRPNEFFS